jgi:hypothetical protein
MDGDQQDAAYSGRKYAACAPRVWLAGVTIRGLAVEGAPTVLKLDYIRFTLGLRCSC